MRKFFQQQSQNWLKRRIPPSRNIVLNINNIFIVPNRQGLGFCFVLGLMFIGAINYEINLAFALVFLLASLFILTIFYTFRNLSGLHIAATTPSAIFVGESAEINIILNRHGKRVYESIELSFKHSRKLNANLIEENEQRVSLFVPALKRGFFSPDRLRIETLFPFGICRAWSLVDLDLNCLVYPQPLASELSWVSDTHSDTGKTNISQGNDDFYSLREYQREDSLKHVDWKKLAKGQGMYTKQYASNVDDEVWLNWNMFPDAGVEERLSRLCYCVLKLDATGIDYGLNIPGAKVTPAKGNAHCATVLEILALYDHGVLR